MTAPKGRLEGGRDNEKESSAKNNFRFDNITNSNTSIHLVCLSYLCCNREMDMEVMKIKVIPPNAAEGTAVIFAVVNRNYPR